MGPLGPLGQGLGPGLGPWTRPGPGPNGLGPMDRAQAQIAQSLAKSRVDIANVRIHNF